MMAHNKPKKANINIIPESIRFQCDYLSFVLYIFGIELFFLIFLLCRQTTWVPLEILQSLNQSDQPPKRPSLWILKMSCYQTMSRNAL